MCVGYSVCMGGLVCVWVGYSVCMGGLVCVWVG